MIAQNIVNTKTEKENNFSSNLIEKYLAYKVKKVINALTLFEVKTKIKLDVLIDLYIYLCKREIFQAIDSNIFISKKEINFFQNFISNKKKKTEKEKQNEKNRVKRMHIAESYINMSQITQHFMDENPDNDYKFKHLLYNVKKTKGCSLDKVKKNEIKKVPPIKLKLLPQIQTNHSSLFNRISRDSKFIRRNENKQNIIFGVCKNNANSFSEERFAYKPINKKKIYSSGDVYFINKEKIKNSSFGKSVDYSSKIIIN